MFKCDLCRDRLHENKKPHCIEACPKGAMKIGRRDEIFAKAKELQEKYKGYIYGMNENDGTSTIYVSAIDFAKIDQAIIADNKKAKTDGVKLPPKPRMHKPENMLNKHSLLAKLAVGAPLIGALGAFFLATKNRVKREEG